MRCLRQIVTHTQLLGWRRIPCTHPTANTPASAHNSAHHLTFAALCPRHPRRPHAPLNGVCQEFCAVSQRRGQHAACGLVIRTHRRALTHHRSLSQQGMHQGSLSSIPVGSEAGSQRLHITMGQVGKLM
jgi:hypothetical protein